MPVPTPPSSLDGSCSVIYENTLYSYTSEAFLSLRLEEGAKWKKLPMGEGVTGAVCVGTTSADPAFVVVGGTGGSDGYSGLQQYSFSTGNWSTITPSVLVTQDRQWHGATYIKADDVILVYAGSQDGVKAPSQQTFTIQASAPYAVKAYSANAPATVEPILLNWSDADACMIGGDTTNTVVSLFNPTALWRDSGATLAQPLTKDRSSIQAVMMLGDDSSKSIYTFDLTVSPNVVDRIVLQDASGAPVANSAAITDKRDLTLSDWPSYNSTLAPTETRSNYAIAQGDGMVIFSGGNDADPIAMFDADGNSWMNATAFLSEDQQKILDTTSTESASSATATSTTSHKKHKTSTISTATDATSTSFTTTAIAENSASATAAETTTAAAVAAAATGNSTDLSSNTILGITLGSILAFMTVLGIILFLIRRRKARRQHLEAGHARRDSGPAMDEKDPVAFSNGTHHEPPSPGYFRGHHPQLSNESYSSMAILMGRVGQQKSSLTRKPSNDSQSSSASTLHKQQLKSTISKPIPQPRPQIMQHPALQGQDDKGVAFDPTVVEPRRRNGPLEAQDGMRRSSGWNRYWSGGSALQILGFGGSKRTTMGSDQSSHYSESVRQNPRVTQDSATVPPLNFEGRPEVNRVNSGSPVVASYGSKIPFKDGMAGKIVDRPSSKASSGYSSGIPESVNDAWDPNDAANKPWGTDRAPSSAYNPSFYYATPLSPSRSGTRHPPSGVSKQPQLAMASTSSDMSWLNLGDQSRV